MQVREKSSQSRRIHFATLRDEIGVPPKIKDFEGVLELNRQVCLITGGEN
jgi:hypothetical protein